jgi:hypothetical protein
MRRVLFTFLRVHLSCILPWRFPASPISMLRQSARVVTPNRARSPGHRATQRAPLARRIGRSQNASHEFVPFSRADFDRTCLTRPRRILLAQTGCICTHMRREDTAALVLGEDQRNQRAAGAIVRPQTFLVTGTQSANAHKPIPHRSRTLQSERTKSYQK